MRTLFLFLGAFLLTNAESAEYRASAYTENVFQQGERAVSSKLKVQVDRSFLADFSPFFQAGQELSFNTHWGESPIDSISSFAYLAPGLQWRFGGFSLTGEMRVRKFFGDSPTQSTFDARALAIYGNFFPSSPVGPLTGFLEPYSETVLSSADQWNVIATNYVRAGARLTMGLTHFDLFLEPSVSVDRVGHYYYNRAVIRPSVRLQYVRDAFAVGMIGSYTISRSFREMAGESNPYSNPMRGMRGLAFLSAEL